MPTNVIRRILTGAALIVATAIMVSLGEASVIFLLFFIGVLIQYELSTMLLPNNRKAGVLCIVFGQILFSILLLFTKGWCWLNMWIFLSALGILTIPTSWKRSQSEQPWLLAALLLYTSNGLACLYWLYSTCTAWLALVLIATWSSDTLAYTYGRLAGHRPLCPAISKSKTWEGLWAGVCGALALPTMAWLFAKYMTWPAWQGITISDMLCVSVICAMIAPVGDLCESKLKRIVQVKDSSQILPGHGGMLDRTDGLLPCAMVVWTWLCYMGK
ncbi:MAG: phosphatidate cytidylyltransferase [Myxococcota bacterium]